MDLNVLLEGKVDVPRFSQVVDELGHEGRIWSLRKLKTEHLIALFEGAAGFRPLTLEHFVPAGTEPLAEVVHTGAGSLPGTHACEKAFCRPAGENGAVLFGYARRGVKGAGPGYFVVTPATAEGSPQGVQLREGEVLFDYRKPVTQKPDFWPPVTRNDHGVARGVYADTYEIVRGVSEHVCVARAVRGEVLVDAWFVLCRVPAA